MKTIIELIVQLAGGVVLLFAIGWLVARLTGYDEYYDNMLYDDDTDETYNQDNDEDMIHHLYL